MDHVLFFFWGGGADLFNLYPNLIFFFSRVPAGACLPRTPLPLLYARPDKAQLLLVIYEKMENNVPRPVRPPMATKHRADKIPFRRF